MAITKVWIEEGCIVCNACEAECPDVFLVTADSCHIKADARVDGKQDENLAAKAELKGDLQKGLEDAIVAAAAGCPVNVIKYDQVANVAEAPAPVTAAPVDAEIEAALGKALGAPEPFPTPAPAPAPAVAAPAPAAEAAADKPRITKVWIEEGCIVCNACEADSPEVFRVTETTCMIKPGVRLDGKETENRVEKNGLKPEDGERLMDSIVAAAKGCPVNVIKYDILGEVAAAEAAPATASADSGPYVYDYKAAPNRQVAMPKTAPLASFHAFEAEQKALAEADEAKWQKQLADFETAKAKAAAEGKEAPKAPVRAVPRKDDNDLKFPAPTDAKDPDLLRLHALLGDKVSQSFEQAGELTCQVHPDCILETLMLCKGDHELNYEMLADQTATHFPAAEGFDFSIVYHLTSIARRKRLRLRVLVKDGQAVDSATQVYPSANWMEREIWDMFGIRFENHPDLTRILCPEDWEGFPLRKEYPTLGWGQRDIDFRQDRAGMLMRMAMEKAGQMGINLVVPKAD
jgi:NADH-quinone oxidoreductase subunit C